MELIVKQEGIVSHFQCVTWLRIQTHNLVVSVNRRSTVKSSRRQPCCDAAIHRDGFYISLWDSFLLLYVPILSLTGMDLLSKREDLLKKNHLL